MRFADVRKDSELRPRDCGERGDVTGAARAHLDDEHVVLVVRRGEEQLRDGDLVVLVSRGREHAPRMVRREQLDEQRFRRRLSRTSGDRDDAPAKPLACRTAERHVRRKRLRDEQRRNLIHARALSIENQGRSPRRNRALRVVVTVETLAAQGEERIAGAQRPRVRRNAQLLRRAFRVEHARARRLYRNVEWKAHARFASASRATLASSKGSTFSPMI